MPNNPELRSWLRAGLPPAALDLMNEMEIFAGVEIGVSPNPVLKSADHGNPNTAAVEITRDGATIFLRDTTKPDPQGWIHELLHIERWWVQGVPQLVSTTNDPGNKNIIAGVDNALEHIIIEPRIETFGINPYPYWNSIARRRWDSYPFEKTLPPFARRAFCLLGWLQFEHVRDAELEARAEACLRQEEIFFDADRFRCLMVKSKASKAKMASLAANFLGIPKTELALQHYDIKTRSLIIRAVP